MPPGPAGRPFVSPLARVVWPLVGHVAGLAERQRSVPAGPVWSGVLVRVAGEVDCSTAPAMRAALDRARGEGEGDLLVDLSGTTFMDCAGLSVLLQARRDWPGRLFLYQPPRSLRRILRALDIEGQFPII